MESPAPASTVAVVTGGSAGLGRAIVRELAARGWDVAVLARGHEGLAGAVADIRSAGRRGLGVSTDVADGAAVEAAAERVERELGPITLWVNNAMVGVFGEFLNTDPADFERALAVNFLGVVNGTRAALTRMVARDRGGVIQIGSALAHRGIPLQSSYCAAKHAITGFSESVRCELLHSSSRVTVSQVDLPAMNTLQFEWVQSQLPHHPMPVPPIFQPEACAAVVADVAQRPRARSWVGEPTVKTVLGNRIAGWFADRYLARTGYDAQQAPDLAASTLAANLYAPVSGDFGARGSFDELAKNGSPQLWAIRNRRLVIGLAAGSGIVASALLAFGRLRRR